jgi:hypothetical protein
LLTDLVAYWELDEGSGTRNDSHTNALHLTDNNTVGSGLGVDGVSTAGEFTAANTEYLSRASEAALQPSAATGFTYVVWFRATNAANTGFLGSKDDSVLRTWNLAVYASNLYIEVHSDSGAVQAVSHPTALSSNTWYMASIAWDPADLKGKVRLNGGTSTDTAALASAIDVDDASPFIIGMRGDNNSPFDGRLQCAGLWTRVLTAAELTWLYNSGTAARTYSAVAAYTG